MWRLAVMSTGYTPCGRGYAAEAACLRFIAMATLSLKGIKKIYDGGVTAVHDFNLKKIIKKNERKGQTSPAGLQTILGMLCSQAGGTSQ